MRVLVSAILFYACSAHAAKRDEPELLTVRAAQAELRGRPSLSSSVTGFVRRGESLEVVRSSSDRRWVQVEIGGGELAWIEARALTAGAAAPEPDREHTLRTPRQASARADEDRRFDDDPPRRIERRRDDDPPRRIERPRDGDPRPPRREQPEARSDPPPPVKRAAREPVREVHDDPPPSPPAPAPVARAPALQSSRPLRDIPAAKPGELFAADLDDERPPSRPGEGTRAK